MALPFFAHFLLVIIKFVAPKLSRAECYNYFTLTIVFLNIILVVAIVAFLRKY